MTKHSEAEYKKALKLYKTFSIKELRRRQNITNEQLSTCHNHLVAWEKMGGNIDSWNPNLLEAMNHLDRVNKLLTQAVDYVAFGPVPQKETAT